jgi:uncharacterized protein (TIGR03083 family)
MDLARRVASITANSDALADASAVDLTAAVTSCPGWTAADLVRHVRQVHHAWGVIVAEQRMGPEFEPAPPIDDAGLVEDFRARAHAFADVLGRTDPASPCWTWGPEQNAGFVQRFQVQEAALHRWDAQDAVGTAAPIDGEAAADAVELFADLLAVVAPVAPYSFTAEITGAGGRQVPMLAADGRPDAGTLRGTASDLLLVLWRRVPLTTVAVEGDADAITATLLAADFD